METDENQEGVRVTRARTRRLSTTDSRPSTPLLDLQPDRASPRPTRRTRLNTADSMTPTRTTRHSLARGETPEPPSTPTASAVKRATKARTPAAKIVRKQLTLNEDISEEIEESPKSVSPGEKRVTRSMSSTPPSVQAEKKAVTKVKEVELEQKLSDSSKPKKATIKLTRAKSPKVEETASEASVQNGNDLINLNDDSESIKPVEKAEKEIENPKDEIKSSPENLNKKSPQKEIQTISKEIKIPLKEKQSRKSGENGALNDCFEDIDEILTVDIPMDFAEEVTVPFEEEKPEESKISENNNNIGEIEEKVENKTVPEQEEVKVETPQPAELNKSARKTISPEIGVEIEAKTDPNKSVSSETPKKTATPDKSIEREPPIEDSPDQAAVATVEEKADTSLDNNAKQASPISSETAAEKAIKKSTEAQSSIHSELDKQSEQQSHAKEEKMEVDQEEVEILSIMKLPNLTPGLKSRVIDAQLESKSVVLFSEETVKEDAVKTKYPKTPARVKPQDKEKFIHLKVDTPSKTPEVLKSRNSSTPIAQAQKVAKEDDEPPQPVPKKLDVIKSLAEEESEKQEVKVKSNSKAATFGDESVDDEEEDEQEISYEKNDFVDDEAECVEDYQSGDSMDSAERREILENEIPVDGESVGSRDTTDQSDAADSSDDDSFIVSDDNVHYLSEPEDGEMVNASASRKKRSRIITVYTTSSDSDIEDVGKPTPKNASGASSNASHLSEAAQLLGKSLEEKESDLSPEAQKELNSSRKNFLRELNKSDRFNKTAQLLDENPKEDSAEMVAEAEAETDMQPLAVVSSSEEDDEQLQANPPVKRRFSKSVYEIHDSEEDVEKAEGKRQSQRLSQGEEGLLNDLEHLKPLFNPLQKSRRQTLNIPSPEGIVLKPKLKRRSIDHLSSNEFNPSQSFIETLSKEKPQNTKRKRLSKSFSAAGDPELADVAHEHKKTKIHTKTDTESEAEAEEVAEEDKVDEAETEIVEEEKVVDEAAATEEEAAPPEGGAVEKEKEPKNREFYLDYCDAMLEAANQAALEQKKQRIATGGNQKKKPSKNRAVKEEAKTDDLPTKKEPIKVKKDLKRLQSVMQAVQHSIKMLAPQSSSDQPQSLARKISPQPPSSFQEKKTSAKSGKAKQKSISPQKTSDEENRSHHVNRIKTRAGYFTVTEEKSPQKSKLIEFVKTSSGIMRVEASTPTSKFFREMPPSPKANRHGFFEVREQPRKRHGQQVAGGCNLNHATQSALRFKERVYKKVNNRVNRP